MQKKNSLVDLHYFLNFERLGHSNVLGVLQGNTNAELNQYCQIVIQYGFVFIIFKPSRY